MSAGVTTNLRIGGVNDSPSLGSTNLSKDEVAQAIDALQKKMAPAYFGGTNLLNEHPFNARITVYTSENQLVQKDPKLEHEKYSIIAQVRIKYLQDKDALDHLLIKLRNRLFELGCIKKSGCEMFSIVYEKGISETNHAKSTSHWHRDGGWKTSISTCFSSIKNWSTQIVDEKKIPEEMKADLRDNLESLREPAIHGFLYDVLNILHRAPLSSDLDGVGHNDYRLFIRYEDY